VGLGNEKNQRQRTKRELRLGPVKTVRKFVSFFFFHLLIAELKNWLSASEKSVAACTWKK